MGLTFLPLTHSLHRWGWEECLGLGWDMGSGKVCNGAGVTRGPGRPHVGVCLGRPHNNKSMDLFTTKVNNVTTKFTNNKGHKAGVAGWQAQRAMGAINKPVQITTVPGVKV